MKEDDDDISARDDFLRGMVIPERPVEDDSGADPAGNGLVAANEPDVSRGEFE